MAKPEQVNTQMKDIEYAISSGLEVYSETFAKGKKYFEPSPVIAGLREKWQSSEDWAERVKLINELKRKSAIKMRWELRKAGFTEGLEYEGTEFNHKLGETKDYKIKGRTIHIEALKLDLVKFKDKNGIVYSYPIGDEIYALNAASTISKNVVSSMPDYAKKNFKGLLLTEQTHPADKFWQEFYKDTNYKFQTGAMYSGEPISIHHQYSFSQITKGDIIEGGCLRASLLHEIGHHLEKEIKTANDWAEIIKKDNKYFRKYSENAFVQKGNPNEDIADAFSMFITNPIRLQKDYPHRYRAISTFIKKIS